MKIHSSIRPELKKQVLMRGSIFAGIGALLLLLTGAFLPLSLLKYWGWLIFLMSMGLITLGLLPYRKLTRLEKVPQAIEIEKDRMVVYSDHKLLMAIPFSTIQNLEYIDKEGDYGIGIWLKHPIEEKIILKSDKFDILNYTNLSRRKFGCDLMFPYFSKRGYEELKEHTLEGDHD